MQYALVQKGKILRAFDSLPESWAERDDIQELSKEELEHLGFFKIVDQREELAPGYTYGKQEFSFINNVVYLNAEIKPPQPPSQDALDELAARQYIKLQALKAMTPAQVKTWVTNNVNTLADAKDAITTLAIAVAVLARRI